MRVLYLTSSEEDYLSDSLLLGFRQLFGANVVDYPRRDVLYRDCPKAVLSQVRGYGFTLYSGVLEEQVVDRFSIRPKLEKKWYDLVVVSDIWRQFGLFAQWRQYLCPENTILVDGEDTPQVYPYAGLWLRRPSLWALPRATRGFLYFKREWTGDSRFNLWHRVLPRGVRGSLPHYAGLRRISFSIPEEKIVTFSPRKTKDFGRHVVDAEIAAKVPGSSAAYTFASEPEYYADLQSSRFGVTTRRAGWDCLRHYEIAANGAVPCFRDLQAKPANCAPHGLLPGQNCLSYQDAEDLFRKINTLDDNAYALLQRSALAWARSKSTRTIAAEVILEWQRIRRNVRIKDASTNLASRPSEFPGTAGQILSSKRSGKEPRFS